MSASDTEQVDYPKEPFEVPRSRWQFRLATLLILMAVSAALLAGWRSRYQAYQVEQAAVEHFESLGGHVWPDRHAMEWVNVLFGQVTHLDLSNADYQDGDLQP